MTTPVIEGSTRYQDLRAFCRRYDRDATLHMLSVASRAWDGHPTDERGRVKPFLPWDIAGVAATLLQWGTAGGGAPTQDELRRMCWMFLNLEHPGIGEPGAGIAMVLRLIYSQMPFQAPDARMQWARAVAIFRDTEFQEGYVPEVMTPGWQKELLGCSVEQWVSIGFALHAALRQGHYPFEWTRELAPILDALGGSDDFDRVVRQGFTTTLGDYRAQRRTHVERFGGTAAQQFLREPFAYNPLFSAPLIEGVADHFVAPCFPAIEVRASALGIVHEGTSQWGEAFRRDSGQLFEQYVGRQLRQISGATVVHELTYGSRRNRKKTIDWFVILPDVVLLIECKAMTPARNLQEGFGTVEQVHARLAKPLEQVNNTVQALAVGHAELADIPTDRPVVALVATLGNFVMANGPEVRESLPVTTVPSAFVGVDFLEALVTTDAVEMSRYFAAVHAPDDRPGVLPVEDINLIGGTNALLKAAFESLPILSLTPRE
ncbi:nuclease-related domain-containing protein [Microbacterium sp. NPDC077663]|uniref:nuclease-related domain-containing protein n=1 Tax=Microbacterium sp. NPDC077663 TaxID=3364189 RepID=UPI0037C76D2B